MKKRLELLASMPVFDGLDTATFDLLAQLALRVAVKAGECFFREGDQSQAMYVLESGQVDVCKIWESESWTMETLTPGDCFGEMALIDLLPRSASAVAVKSSKALEITPAILQEVNLQNPAQFTLLHINMGRQVSRRLRKLDDMVFRTFMSMSLIGSTSDDLL
jgi:CRP/FNR family cyclic AMP-dependent transcriptional regulator